MIIRKNIKSRIKSKAFRSLPERRNKRHLSFYSSIERDIRDIEMKLYRIKKALKYYSEDSSNEIPINNPSRFVGLIDFGQLKTTPQYFDKAREIVEENATMSRRRKDYSIFINREEIKNRVQQVLMSGQNKTRFENIKASFEQATNEQQLANAISELLSFMHDLKVQFIESVWKKVSSVTRFLFICGGITLAIIEFIFPGAIGALGKSIYGNAGNLDAIGIAFTGIFIATVSSGVLFLLAERAAVENKKAQKMLRKLEEDYIAFLERVAENIVKVKLTPVEFQTIKEYMFAGSKEVAKQEHIREGGGVENLVSDLQEIDIKVRAAMKKVEDLIASKLEQNT